jgi:alpha-glucosidase
VRQGDANGDWLDLGVREGDALGNGFMGFQEAAVGNVQIPVYYAVGADSLNYALFMDNVYKQRWDFTVDWWQARMFGDQLRWYLMTGPNLPDLRADYMELTGTPPVPPRKAFGLWISEFGYDNFDQIENLLSGLRSNDFPVDGFVLDLNWFGGVVLNDPTKSTMGRIDWDEDQTLELAANPYSFSNPGQRIADLHEDHIGLVAIEESYLANTTDTFVQMPGDLTAYKRINGICDETDQSQIETDVSGFWGQGRMIDWSDPVAGRWIHDNRRFPNLTQLGIASHWTDLGEPERYKGSACYEGVETTVSGRKNEHSDIHNIYNLLWNLSIWDGYYEKRGQANALGLANPRPFIMTRSGAGGTQRTGAAMWSGDIASNLESLSTHANAQLHMSFSGIDYYGSDTGGFRRETMPYNDKQGNYRGYEDELYTQWFANAAWFDTPVRPHTDNEFVKVAQPYATAPHLVGHVASNRANIRQRYALIPYYYSLAHLAHQSGEAVIPPPAIYFQNDPELAGVGHQKMIGRDIMVGIVARHGEYERDLYLPAGRWVNYHSNEWIESAGQRIIDLPAYRGGLLRLPVFIRAGAIVPKMHIDSATKDAFGNRKDGRAAETDFIVRVYADPLATSFTVFEDDGTTLQYDTDGRPFYHHRTTEVSQQQTSIESATVTIGPVVNVNGAGPYSGAVNDRHNIVELVVDGARATQVKLNNVTLVRWSDAETLQAAPSGWANAGSNLVLAKSPMMSIESTTKRFDFTLEPVSLTTSVNFVCDNGFTSPGQSIYVVGSISSLGAWDPRKAIRLFPSIYWQYIYDSPEDHNGPGPSQPIWTGVVSDLVSKPSFEWKCIRRSEDGSGGITWQPGENNIFSSDVISGYAGRTYGAL